MSLKPYKLEFADGSARTATLSEYKRFSRRDDFELVGTDTLRQIKPQPSYFGEKLVAALTGQEAPTDPFGFAEAPGLKAVGCTSDMSIARSASKAVRAVELGNACWI